MSHDCNSPSEQDTLHSEFWLNKSQGLHYTNTDFQQRSKSVKINVRKQFTKTLILFFQIINLYKRQWQKLFVYIKAFIHRVVRILHDLEGHRSYPEFINPLVSSRLFVLSEQSLTCLNAKPGLKKLTSIQTFIL